MRLIVFLLFYAANVIFFSFRLPAQIVTRGPYLNLATPNSITIRWRTDIPTNSQVQYGLTPNNLNNTFNQLNFTTEHKVTLSNLQPDTRYFYSIGTTTQILQGDTQNHFTSSPVSSPHYNKPVRFWVMGDMGKQTQQQIDVREAFKKYTDSLPVSGWVLLGDNAYNSGFDIEYQNGFFNYYQNDITKNIPLWPCLGNHDYGNNYTLRINHQIPYLDIFTLPKNGEAGGLASNSARYYSFDFGNIHFVNLDSYGLDSAGGLYYALSDTLYSPQIQWLKNDLSANNLPWVIVSFHHPPYCMGTHNSDIEADLLYLRTNLNPILERYNVDLVLSGHCHTYQRSHLMRNHFGLEISFDSTMHIVQPGSGKYDGSPNSCTYIKNKASVKDTGTIYMVVGSGSAVPQLPFASWPHEAMYYSNYENNGSLLITVEGNRLSTAWISTDTAQVVKDYFTIIKNSNKRKKVGCYFPGFVTLQAVWDQAPFLWYTGDTTRKITFFASQDTTIIVNDLYNCISDTFDIVDSASLLNKKDFEILRAVIYPNPAHHEIMIQLQETGVYEITLTDEKGKRMEHKKLQIDNSPYRFMLDTSLPAGNYFLSIKNDMNQVFTDKITVVQ